MKKFFIMMVVFFILIIIPSKSILANENREQGFYQVSNFEIIEDVNGDYSFAEVNSLAFNEKYTKYSNDILSLGIGKSIYWVRFKFPVALSDNLSDNLLLQFNNHNLDKIDLYMPCSKQGESYGYIVKESGSSRPMANKEIVHNTWVFQLPSDFVRENYK